mgnify:CR=1 FL=1
MTGGVDDVEIGGLAALEGAEVDLNLDGVIRPGDTGNLDFAAFGARTPLGRIAQLDPSLGVVEIHIVGPLSEGISGSFASIRGGKG